MEYRKTIIFLMVAIFIFSITAVSASDMNDTAIDSDDISQMGLSTSNDVDNLKLSEENTTITYTNNVEIVGVGIDSAVMSADTGTYSGLSEEIGNGGNIELKHAYYTYNTGDTIEITVDNSVIDGKDAVIDMAGSNIRAFDVTAYDVTIKNLTIKNANYKGNGGAIYFSSSGTVTDCNFTNNTASENGGAVYFYKEGIMTDCNFTNNTASENGGAVYFYDKSIMTDCIFTDNIASTDGGAISLNYGTVENCNFTDNKASREGGAISMEGTVENCNFTDNKASDNGGAIYFWDDSTVTNCNFVNNTAKHKGGAIFSAKYNPVTGGYMYF